MTPKDWTFKVVNVDYPFVVKFVLSYISSVLSCVQVYGFYFPVNVCCIYTIRKVECCSCWWTFLCQWPKKQGVLKPHFQNIYEERALTSMNTDDDEKGQK